MVAAYARCSSALPNTYAGFFISSAFSFAAFTMTASVSSALGLPFPLGCSLASCTPYLAPHLVKGFHYPFDDMERMDAAFAFRGEFIHVFRDPLRPIAGDYLDRGKLFRRKLPVKQRQDTLSVPLCRPHDRGAKTPLYLSCL